MKLNYPSLLAPLGLAIALGGCAVGPDYQRPAFEAPQQFRHAEGWKAAAPADEAERGAWWQLYGDEELNALVEQLNLDNQNLAASESQYRQARALVRSARASFYPNLGISAGAGRSGSGSNVAGQNAINQNYDLGLNLAWELDIWGKLRRNLEASDAEFQASAAELAALRLSLQGELVRNYLQLRVLDEQSRLLERTVQAYQRSLKLTENQYNAGIAPRSDVTQAITQLRGTEAQLVDLQWQRAQLEHAIAVLIEIGRAHV